MIAALFTLACCLTDLSISTGILDTLLAENVRIKIILTSFAFASDEHDLFLLEITSL